jgi:carnosine N-methyltransferase
VIDVDLFRRLPLEITSVGYAAQGNEFSAYMAIPSNFLLNEVVEPNCFCIHPWIDRYNLTHYAVLQLMIFPRRVSNVVMVADVLESYTIPDVTAVEMLEREIIFSDGTTSASVTTESAAHEGHSDTMAFDPNSFPRFSMCLGDFVDIYSASDNECFWDAITTCFFVDTAPVASTFRVLYVYIEV